MTCREKYNKEHPNSSTTIACPSDAGYLDDPVWCGDEDSNMSCRECWDREILDKETIMEGLLGEADESAVEQTSDNCTVDEPVILDSGDRTKFESGAVRDMHDGKGRMDLLPWAAVMEVSKHCENGAKKYGEHNVDKGIPTSSLCDSAARHLAKYLDGWTDEPHLLAAAWNLLWALQMHIKHPEVVDTPWRYENTTSTPKE